MTVERAAARGPRRRDGRGCCSCCRAGQGRAGPRRPPAAVCPRIEGAGPFCPAPPVRPAPARTAGPGEAAGTPQPSRSATASEREPEPERDRSWSRSWSRHCGARSGAPQPSRASRGASPLKKSELCSWAGWLRCSAPRITCPSNALAP